MGFDIDTITNKIGGAAARATSDAGLDKDRIKSLAEQFEATMVSQMLKGMQTSLFEGEDGESSSSGVGPLSDALFSELSLAITKAGGLGIANAMMAPLVAQTAMPGAPNLAATASATAAAATTGRIAGGVSLEPALQPLAAAGIPLPGRVSSAYGMRHDPISGDARLHKGTDIPMPYGADVRTAGAGTVVSVGELKGYGLQVVVDHGDGVTTRYAHLSGAAVKPGDAVERGQVIAAAGNSGRSTGSHLHFEVMTQGKAIDPQGSQASALLGPL
jgi:murein DD-endopeptidase MepM/ murein hydrolase activator NlpD